MSSAGFDSDVLGVADVYDGLIDGLVIDEQDATARQQLEQRGLDVAVCQTLMTQPQQKQALMEQTVAFALAQSARSVA